MEFNACFSKLMFQINIFPSLQIIDGLEQPTDTTSLPPGPLISCSEVVRYENYYYYYYFFYTGVQEF